MRRLQMQGNTWGVGVGDVVISREVVMYRSGLRCFESISLGLGRVGTHRVVRWAVLGG